MYRNSELPGFVHLYIGEEATAVGVMAHLRPDDWITSTHRGHGHALAKGVPPKVVLAELAGKATGCCGGRGGSMHLYAPAVGLFGTNGVVAGGDSVGRRIGHQRQGPRHRPGGRGLLRRRGQQPRRVSRGRSISAASRTRPSCSSAKTTSTPRPRRSAWPRETPTSPARRRPMAFPACESTATTCWPFGRRRERRSAAHAPARGRRSSSRSPIARSAIRKATRSSAGAARRRSGTLG